MYLLFAIKKASLQDSSINSCPMMSGRGIFVWCCTLGVLLGPTYHPMSAAKVKLKLNLVNGDCFWMNVSHPLVEDWWLSQRVNLSFFYIYITFCLVGPVMCNARIAFSALASFSRHLRSSSSSVVDLAMSATARGDRLIAHRTKVRAHSVHTNVLFPNNTPNRGQDDLFVMCFFVTKKESLQKSSKGDKCA